MSRRFVGTIQSIKGGEFTPEELRAAQAVGYINEFQPTRPNGERLGAVDIAIEASKRAPRGWHVVAGLATHEGDPEPPEFNPEGILMGWVKVNHDQPGSPMWLCRKLK